MKKITNITIVVGILVYFLIVGAQAAVTIAASQVTYNGTTVQNKVDELVESVHITEKLGDTNISDIGDGTLTGAINQIGKSISHVGSVIHSTTLDTMEKVIAVYGGTTWVKIEGRFLLGQSSSYAINSTGGEAMHTLTIAEMPSHTHVVANYMSVVGWEKESPSYSYLNNTNDGWVGSYNPSSKATGGSGPHNNMPPYQVVYIWERTA